MLHISSLRRRQRQRRHRTDDPAARTTSLACGVVPFPLSCGSNSEAPWAVQDPGELGRTTAFSGVPLQRRRYYRQSRRRCMQGTWRQDNGLKLWAPAAGSTGGISRRRPASALLRVVIWCAEHTSGLQRQEIHVPTSNFDKEILPTNRCYGLTSQMNTFYFIQGYIQHACEHMDGFGGCHGLSILN
ncbi:uncharacterized protein LOC119316936 isoform X4 [Triticum dicoccoides]|uniref:uncharacterized protein LOC119316936 isoform X4 n=1 Tax=Triticum dicoccoides TaxID=85692 RepID=UPI00189129A6|nr:uncharacterized protein LOC119316936 isoform X4 [Triticum dicoccoides]